MCWCCGLLVGLSGGFGCCFGWLCVVFSTRRCLGVFCRVCGVVVGWLVCVGGVGGVGCSLAAARRPASFGGLVLSGVWWWFENSRACLYYFFIVNDCQSGPRFRAGCLIVLRGSPRGRLMGVGVFVRVAFPY